MVWSILISNSDPVSKLNSMFMIVDKLKVKLPYRAIILFFLLIFQGRADAQQFNVKLFRELPNDITSYINPVVDLNNEACALIKVICNSDFAFSTPLGIVKRKNEVGEVWLYLPKGSVLITLKHPQWGVIRDYRLPKPLESRVTYELQLSTPYVEESANAGPVVVVQKDTVLVRDTVISQKIVEVPVKKIRKERPPVVWSAGVAISVSEYSPAYGLRVMAMRRHGLYIGGYWNMNSTPTAGKCNSDGLSIDGKETPYDTGRVRDSRYAVVAGGVEKICNNLYLYEGIGYGSREILYEKVDAGWWLNEDDSYRGFAAEAGIMYQLGRVHITAGVMTYSGKCWEPSAGVSLTF